MRSAVRAAVVVLGVLGPVCQRHVAAWNLRHLNPDGVLYDSEADASNVSFDSRVDSPRLIQNTVDHEAGSTFVSSYEDSRSRAAIRPKLAAIVPHRGTSSSALASANNGEELTPVVKRKIQKTRQHESDAMAFTSRRSASNFTVERSELETVDVTSNARLFPSVTCTAAKAILCIGGLAALGAFGVRYSRDYMRRRRRAKFDQGPTPFTKLLGPVLLSNVPEDLHLERRATRRRKTGKGLLSGGGAPEEVSTAETLGKHGHITALYFTGRGVEKLLEGKGYVAFTPRLRSIVEAADSKGQKVDVVYVSADASEADASEHFRTMPWYAVPFDDKDGRERIRNLFRKCRVTTLPSVVLLDESGRVVNSQAYTSMLANPQGFPWRRQKVLQMLGDSVVNQKGETIKHESLKGRRVGIYFSASWCPPCRSFTPKLVDAMKKLRERGENVEVIFVSSDKDEKSFEEYFKKMEGFYAVPFKDATTRAILQDNLGVRALPTLIWVDEKGEEATRRGVPLLISDPDLNSYPWEDKLVYDVVDSVDGIVEEPILIAFIERVSEDVQRKTVEVLEKAARVLKEVGDDGSVTPRVRFYTAKTNSPRAAALRQICGRDVGGSTKVDADRGNGVELVILDLFNQRVFDIPLNQDEDLTAELLLSAIEKFKAEELLGKPIVLPE